MNDFILLLSGTIKADPTLSLEEQQQVMQKYLHWLTDLKENGIVKSGQPLDNSGRKITNKEGIITDGPFIESKEAVGGYFIISASDLDHATAIAKTCPHVLMGGEIEIRQLQEI